MPVSPQAALEQAVVNLLRSAGGMGLPASKCGRSVLDGQPPPVMGPEYVAVWSKSGKRPGQALARDQVLSVMVTVTVRLALPFDRAVEHRDRLEALCDSVVDLVALDRHDFRVCRAANTLAGFRSAGAPDGISDAGFCEPLAWQGTDDAVEVGPDWFHATLEQADRNCGYAQTVRFGGARLIKDFAYLVGDD